MLHLNEVIGEGNALLRGELVAHRVTLSLELAPYLPLVTGAGCNFSGRSINLVRSAVEAMQTAAGDTHRWSARVVPPMESWSP